MMFSRQITAIKLVATCRQFTKVSRLRIIFGPQHEPINGYKVFALVPERRMTISVSPNYTLTAFDQPLAGNSTCMGNYMEFMGNCSMTALGESWGGANCESTGVDCALNFGGGISAAITCNGQQQTYNITTDVSFSVNGTCSAGSSNATISSMASSSMAASSSAASSVPFAIAKSGALKITKSSVLLAAGLVSAMLVALV
ncbi:hypothetical protein INT44_006586 [Umbelopsis vinacea]|uniref:Uncharacterized protein n=1 Tax=Umbelopsis vinacea TaxID=44442 RepID=A0A8H7UH72_9FUNG|nr:hypothetical protein INT44_006586 [Umbelopsis vinacea]